MGSTGSVSSWEEALLVAAIQYPVPVVSGPGDIQVNVDRICKAVAATKAGYPGLDLIVSRIFDAGLKYGHLVL